MELGRVRTSRMARRAATPLLTSAGVHVVVPLPARLRNDPLPVRRDVPKWPAIDPILRNTRDQETSTACH